MHKHEKLVLRAVVSGSATPHQIANSSGLPEGSVMRALKWLEERGAVKLSSTTLRTCELTNEGEEFSANGFPEQRLVESLKQGNEPGDEEKRIGIPWALRNKWIRFTNDKRMEPTDKGISEHGAYALHALLKSIPNGPFPEKQEDALKALQKRGSISIREKREYSAQATGKGRKIESGIGEIRDEINVLTRELILSGKWRDSDLAEYEVNAPVERVFPGKRHPIATLMRRIKAIFSEMGFEEMEGEEAESAFWNFDALFQPQDHPARELADTFYLSGKAKLPDSKLVERVRKAHETGWKYQWDENVAKERVLRTHTTAVSARYVAKSRGIPSKYFCVGRVYRNEKTDFKHLAEFFQVEGIVIWENATFCDLLGLLREFYSKLGFEKIRFRPSYFPYTEPSLEVEVYFEDKRQWMELGGAGVFRPEVCLPLCGKFPVLAWGLSLERPLMLKAGIEDIRTFYKNDIAWLRDYKRVL